MSREELEQRALKACHPDIFYELEDNLEITTDAELWQVIREGESSRKFVADMLLTAILIGVILTARSFI